ncbi:MAG: WhiB family transcriptional regulator [Acidimicrobiales bacterium]
MLDTTDISVETTGTASTDQSWRKSSSCASVDPEIFFGEDQVSRAKQICASCPVRKECREWADASAEFLGVWGGQTGLERGWGADGGRIEAAADRVIFVCACCDAAVSWPMAPHPTTAPVGKGGWQLHLEQGKAQFLIARSDGRDLKRGGPLRCRNGHEVGFSTGFSGLISFNNDAVLQVPMSQRRQHRSVA